jgi:hypothetical protein
MVLPVSASKIRASATWLVTVISAFMAFSRLFVFLASMIVSPRMYIICSKWSVDNPTWGIILLFFLGNDWKGRGAEGQHNRK